MTGHWPGPGPDCDDVVLDGGPLDGKVHHVERDATQLLVVMDDGARYVYVACASRQAVSDGRLLRVFEFRGRDTPLRSPGD